MEKEIKNTPWREKIYIEYMGCPQRALDARRLENYFIENGAMISKTPKNADHILFISCAFRNTDENFAVKRIGELKKYKARLVLGGCLKAINKERLNEIFYGPTVETSALDQVDQLFPHFQKKIEEISDANRLYPRDKLQLLKLYASSIKKLDFNFLKPISEFIKKKNPKRYWHVRAAWGCTKEHCTYCSVWKAVGELKSKPLDECVKEFREGLKQGYINILITADNLGAYGTDINLALPDLLEKLTEIKGDYSIQLENVHPFFIIKHLERLLPSFRSNKIRAVLCPIQSGSDRILALMNRRYKTEQIKRSLVKIKEASPGIELYTQIILGFPSETQAEFEETLACVQEIDFDFAHICGYHRRPNQDNKNLINQEIPCDTIKQRINETIKFFKKNKIGFFVYPE